MGHERRSPPADLPACRGFLPNTPSPYAHVKGDQRPQVLSCGGLEFGTALSSVLESPITSLSDYLPTCPPAYLPTDSGDGDA